MKLGFYYHIPICQQEGQLKLPSYLGVFIDALAKEVDQLYLLLHECPPALAHEADYTLTATNLTWVNLGLKTPAWHRTLFFKKILQTKLQEVENCNVIIVRSPSPLAPFFSRYIHKPRLCFMIVGDYSESVQNMKALGVRDQVIKQFLRLNNWLFEREIRKSTVLVNSPLLYRKYQGLAKELFQIRTTTLSDNDFFQREDTCQQRKIELLFTGRIDPNKGLFELLEATSHLIHNAKVEVRLNMVGWEQEAHKPVEAALLKRAQELQISDHLIFHGRKKVGDELNAMYRMADIYIIASYHEGFPRTIWEAMANSLPVIATKVGAIPDYLTHEKNVFLIEPKQIQEIIQAVATLMANQELRKTIIRNGFVTAKENTLEFQTKKLVNILDHVATT